MRKLCDGVTVSLTNGGFCQKAKLDLLIDLKKLKIKSLHMAILCELLNPLSTQDFLEKYYLRMPYAAPYSARRFEGFLSSSLLQEIIDSGHPDCWLPKEGLLPEESNLKSGTLNWKTALSSYQQGRTILIRSAEQAHLQIKSIAQDFHNFFKVPIDIQIYCTPSAQEGFTWHYDLADVFVIQCAGEKLFRLKKNTVNPRPLFMPKDQEYEKETNKIEIQCLLKQGDWLYIPAGYWHKARAITDSAHLSIGVLSSYPHI